jgi:hypothetical protein
MVHRFVFLGCVVLATAFMLSLQTVRWNWPRPVRWAAGIVVVAGYCALLFWDLDPYWPYRLASVVVVCLGWRLPHGLSKTFLPAFIASFKSAQERQKNGV